MSNTIIIPDNTLILPNEENITIVNEPIYAETNKKVAYINLETGIVENIIVVSSINDPVPEGYKIIEIPTYEIEYTQEEQDLYEILTTVNPNFVPPPKKKQERSIHINETKWNGEQGFFEE